LGGEVRHTYTRKLVYVALSMRDAEYQTCYAGFDKLKRHQKVEKNNIEMHTA